MQYILKTPIKISHEGQMIDASIVELNEPTRKQFKKSYRLKQIFQCALVRARNLVQGGEKSSSAVETSSEDSNTLAPDQVLSILLLGGTDMEACFEAFETLAALGCASLEGKAINKLQWDAIDPEDQEGLLCSFLGSIIFTSMMKAQKNTG